jgi:formylglycine-generating enzyme required for sulfatase activity/predicted NACHT family NTPase
MKESLFKFGKAVVDDKYFVGREKEIKQLKADLLNGVNIILYAPRRFGKTSLILKVLDQLKKEGVKTAYIDLYQVKSCEDFIRLYVSEIIGNSRFSMRKAKKKLSTYIRGILPSVSVDDNGKPILSFSYDANIPREYSLLDALDLPKKLKNKNEKWAIAFDEFQEINRLNEEIIEKQFRSILQHHQDIGYVFLGSKTHMLLNMFADKSRAFYNMGKIQKLNKIPEQEMIDHLEKKFNEGGFTFEQGIFKETLSYTQNIPNYNQFLAYHIWQVAVDEDKIIDKQVIEKAVNLILDNHGDKYYSKLNQLTSYERSVLQAILQGKKNIYSKESAQKNGMMSAFKLEAALERLIELEFIEEMKDKYIFGDPFLLLYLKLRDFDQNYAYNIAEPETLTHRVVEWFKTLGYGTRSKVTRHGDYSQLIVTIPAKRRVDTILVRCVERPVELMDMIELQKGVEENKTDEGWLIASHRIAASACEMAEREKNLYGYTFDQLLDEDADFTRYFDWLKEQVESRGIDKMYIPLACKKDIFDPVKKEKIGRERYDKKNGWIEGYIDRWVQDSSKGHISILGEFGTGKTWFTLHYAYSAMLKYMEAKEKSLERPRLPVVIQLRDYAKLLDSNSLFSDFFFRKHEIRLPGYSAFEYLNRIGKLLLIFDGFDEMADKMDRQKMINNFWELARVVVPGAKAILTCRNEHFPEAKEGRALLNAELKASVMNLTGEPPQFEVLILEHFDDEQIRQALKNRAKDKRTVEYIMKHPLLLDMARRPVLMEYILECIPEIESGKPIDLARVYLYALHKKLDTDLKSGRTFTSLADKLYFMCELSWEMLTTGNMSLNYRLFPDRLKNLFGALVAEEKTLDHWHYDMMGNTMMIRNDDGDYTPAHKSLLEFFVAVKLTAELGFLPADFADLAREQSHVDKSVPPGDNTWDTYFCRRVDENGEVCQIAPLKKFKPADRDRVMEHIAALPEAVLRFIHEITNVDEVREAFHSFLQDTLEEFKKGNREPAKEQGVLVLIYKMARLSQTWEEEAGVGRQVKESWDKFHRGEMRATPAISFTEIIIPGQGDGETESLPLKMVQIPAGLFLMGDDNETPIHRVHITKPFLMSAVLVTNKFFSHVMGKTPSRFKGDNRPVEQVSWFDAVEFCNRLSDTAGLKKVYSIDGEKVKPDWDADGFRLPTEAEWEYACRAGTSGQRYGEIDKIAWYKNNSNNSTQDVGNKEPNAWGLYDMLGNVWEWCWDWHGDYPTEDRENWRGPEGGSDRVFRGGGWGLDVWLCRCAYRFANHPAYRVNDLGFRLVRAL